MGLLAALGTGCPGGKSKITPPELPKVDVAALPLPRSADGKFILIEVAGSRIDLDPTLKDPLTALGGCTDLITYCYAPGERSLDDCVAAATTCGTQKPWEEAFSACCPAACQSAFQAERQKGTEPLAAFDQIFFQDPGCFPGVNALIGGAP